MSYKGNSDTATVFFKKMLKYPENSFSAAMKAAIGPPDYADLYHTGEVRMKWMRQLSDGEKLKVIAIRDKYIDYIVANTKTNKLHFDFDYPEKGRTATSFIIKVIANPDQF